MTNEAALLSCLVALRKVKPIKHPVAPLGRGCLGTWDLAL